MVSCPTWSNNLGRTLLKISYVAVVILLTNFWRCSNDAKMFFWFVYVYWLQISKISVECSVHICSCPWLSLFNLDAFDEFLKGKHFALKLQKIERLQIQAIMINYFKVSWVVIKHCNPLQGQYRARTGFSLCSISTQGKSCCHCRVPS